jgi:hypothetical protein
MPSLNVFLDCIERVINQGMKWHAVIAVPAFSFCIERIEQASCSVLVFTRQQSDVTMSQHTFHTFTVPPGLDAS